MSRETIGLIFWFAAGIIAALAHLWFRRTAKKQESRLAIPPAPQALAVECPACKVWLPLQLRGQAAYVLFQHEKRCPGAQKPPTV